nr:reverse transcriptase domain-containing protein [Tanacetum cinerariifolium]
GKLKRKLTEAPILIASDWDMPFELMCDASDFAIGAVLGQRQEALQANTLCQKANSLKMLSIISGMIPASLKSVLIKSSGGVYLVRKPLIFSMLATLDLLEVTMDQITQPKRAIISDRGTHFCNDQFTKVMQKYGVTHPLATLYHPQTSGQVEVSNHGLKRILERAVGENRASWSDKLDDALWAFFELEHKAYWALKHANFNLKIADDHRKIQINELNELLDQAYKNYLIYKDKTKRIHDSKIKNRVLNVGDRVLLFNSRLKIFSGKLKSDLSGPFTISQIFPTAPSSYHNPMGLTSRSMVIVSSTILERTYLSR